MSRRGPKRQSAENLRRRGSWRAKERAEQERVGTVPMTGRPWLTDALVVAILSPGRHGMSCADIAREAGISKACLSMFFDGKTNLSGETMDRLAWALNLRLHWSDGKRIRIPRTGKV